MGRRQVEQGERLERVEAAAWRLYSAQGFDQTTVRQVAAEAGVSTGTVVNAGGKSGLLVTLFEDALRSRVRQDGAPAGADLSDAVWGRFEVFFAFYGDRPDLTRAYLRALLSDQAGRDTGNELVVEFLQQLTELLARDQPAVRPEDVQLLAETLFAVYLATLIGWLTGPRPLDDALAGCRRHVRHHVTAFERRARR